MTGCLGYCLRSLNFHLKDSLKKCIFTFSVTGCGLSLLNPFRMVERFRLNPDVPKPIYSWKVMWWIPVWVPLTAPIFVTSKNGELQSKSIPPKQFLGGGNSNIFYFHPYLGKWSILTNIFQMAWNHQLDLMKSLQDSNDSNHLPQKRCPFSQTWIYSTRKLAVSPFKDDGLEGWSFPFEVK